MATQKNTHKTEKIVAIGAGAAAIAAGAYFFFGPNGRKHQKKMRGWVVKMKGDVIEKLEEAKDITEPVYNEIVDKVARTYSVADQIPKSEVMALANDLKRDWKAISRLLSGGKKGAKKGSPKQKKSDTMKAKKTNSKRNASK